MTLKTPEHWYRQPQSDTPLIERLLAPVSSLYSLFYSLHQSCHKPSKASIPVLCIGNIVAGGTGKTPSAIALMHTLKNRAIAKNPCFLIRGYGGAAAGPVLVDLDIHTAWDVGDEALILAGYAPTIVGADRIASVEVALENGADLIVMDDGLQNPGIQKDLRLVAINGEMGFGNQKLMPAGPLRQPLEEGYEIADGFILIGDDERGLIDTLPANKPVIRATLKPGAGFKPDTKTPYLAFAGLGYPDKFFNFMSKTLGMNVCESIAFSDHHPYEDKDVIALHEQAQKLGARLITTQKDHMRLPKIDGIEIETLPVEMTWENEDALVKLIQSALSS